MLSIEITRDCPLSCSGCYAYGDSHLGGKTTLRDLSDFRGDALVQGVLELVRRHRPMHVSLVGGEPMIRHRELDRILPALDEMGIFTMVVTSGVITIPEHWMKLQRLCVAVSVDGLPEHHDERRKPATYERIVKNIAGRRINVHWVITRPMVLAGASYLEQYVAFWNARPEVDHIWVSLYSPQKNEESAERLRQEDRELVADAFPLLRRMYPKLLIPVGVARAFVKPPESPENCLFSKLSTNYSADLRSGTMRVRRNSGLQTVRVLDQQRTALGSGCESRWTAQGGPSGAGIAARGVGGEEAAWRLYAPKPLATGATIPRPKGSARADSERDGGEWLLVMIGQKKALGIAVRNDRPQRRYSGLLASLRSKL